MRRPGGQPRLGDGRRSWRPQPSCLPCRTTQRGSLGDMPSESSACKREARRKCLYSSTSPGRSLTSFFPPDCDLLLTNACTLLSAAPETQQYVYILRQVTSVGQALPSYTTHSMPALTPKVHVHADLRRGRVLEGCDVECVSVDSLTRG